LPRGDGVVTRRPLELRLNHIQDENTKPWGIFEEIPGKKFYDFPNEVKGNIISLTDKVAGTKCGIVDKPIVLNIYSHTCPDLTLIDLPGITRIPMAGSDQPKNIEEITKGMARRYVSDPRTIILCVTSANADLSTSDGLMMAKEVDPNGIRTIGVLTKIDIMDKGTNAKRMLTGQDIPLRLGYVGIKNRSQQDILENMSVKDAIEREKLYFATHPLYSTMPPGLLGTEVLSTKCSKVMFTHIKHNLPEITKEIREKAKDIEDRLRDLGPPLPQGATDKMQLMWNMITDVVTIYKNTISGKFDSRRAGASGQPANAKRELSGGAKIKLHFYNLYKQLANYNATSEYTDGDIEKAIMLHEGDTIPGFPSVDVFVYLI
jgi:vacuolar protein sorting-associated protein 1